MFVFESMRLRMCAAACVRWCCGCCACLISLARLCLYAIVFECVDRACMFVFICVVVWCWVAMGAFLFAIVFNGCSLLLCGG